MDFLKGRRTYVIAVVGALVTGLQLAGFIDTETWGVLMGLLGAGGLATLRAGMKV